MKKSLLTFLAITTAIVIFSGCSNDDENLLSPDTKPEDLRLGYIQQVEGQRPLPEGFRITQTTDYTLHYDKQGVLRSLHFHDRSDKYYDVIYQGNVVVFTDSASAKLHQPNWTYSIYRIILNKQGYAASIEKTTTQEPTVQSSTMLTYNSRGQLLRMTETGKDYDSSTSLWQISLWDYTLVSDMNYDEQGVLTSLTSTKERIYQTHMWGGGSIVGKLLGSGKIKESSTLVFNYDKTITNPYLQQMGHSLYDTERFVDALAMIGLLGKGTAYLPTSFKATFVDSRNDETPMSTEYTDNCAYTGSEYGLWSEAYPYNYKLTFGH